MVRRTRLDAELVRRGLARSREHAAATIAAGRVRVGGIVATKSATAVDGSVSLVVADDGEPDYVSRGGHKLAGALDALPALSVSGRHCLDAGASTGGFTDVLLRRGAAHVVAVDVGYGQLAWPLRTDDRVTVMDRTNIRELTPARLDPLPDLLVADLSFIPLTTVLPSLHALTAVDGDLLLMVKPQFEVGRERVPSGGVVRDPQLRAVAVMSVAEAARSLGRGSVAVTASPLPGPAGNVEYFLWLRAGAPALSADAVERAVAEGPS